jgi:hypothetical protein
MICVHACLNSCFVRNYNWQLNITFAGGLLVSEDIIRPELRASARTWFIRCKGNNKITELRTILQRESQDS